MNRRVKSKEVWRKGVQAKTTFTTAATTSFSVRSQVMATEHDVLGLRRNQRDVAYGTMETSDVRHGRRCNVSADNTEDTHLHDGTPSNQQGASIDLPSPVTPQRNNESFTAGVGLLLLVVVLWTSSNFLTNYQLTSGYDKPFAVTYLNTSSFALYLLPFAFAVRRTRHKIDPRKNREAHSFHQQQDGLWERLGFRLPQGSLWHKNVERYDSTCPNSYAGLATSDDAADEERPVQQSGPLHAAQNTLQALPADGTRPSSIDGRRPRLNLGARQTSDNETANLAPLDLHQTAILATHFMIIWFLANYCLNVSLKLTSVASATTLSSASGFFTLALGAVVGVEIFSLAKLGAVTMSFLGVLMVTRADSGPSAGPIPGDGTRQPAAAFSGDMLALASASLYAMYVVLLKKRIVHESRVSMPLFFGFVGLLNIVLMWPMGVILHLAGIEQLALPTGKAMFSGLLANMAITVVSDMAYLIAMLKSSPLVATVGLSLTIPLAIIGDALRGSHSGGVESYIGSAIVLASFVAIGFADRATVN